MSYMYMRKYFEFENKKNGWINKYISRSDIYSNTDYNFNILFVLILCERIRIRNKKNKTV